MDRFGEWRSIEPEEDEQQKILRRAEESAGKESKTDQFRLYAVLAALILAATGVAIWLTSSGSAAETGSLTINAAAFVPRDAQASPLATDDVGPTVVVDVQGAVERPGVQWLDSGARVTDAIAAAGGYSAQVDIGRAAAVLNLAAPIADGAKVHVPSLGEAAAPGSGSGPGGATTGTGSPGLINVNMATADELESLPGVGPVTAAEIIEARSGALFTTVDDLLARQVLGPSTFEQLRDLVTVGP